MKSTSCRGAEIVDLESCETKFVTVRALARYWGVDIATIYRDIKKGALRVYRLPSGALRIKLSDALAYGRPET